MITHEITATEGMEKSVTRYELMIPSTAFSLSPLKKHSSNF
jgi:hypothetical protein